MNLKIKKINLYTDIYWKQIKDYKMFHNTSELGVFMYHNMYEWVCVCVCVCVRARAQDENIK